MHLFEVFAKARRELSNAEVAKLLGVPETSSLDLLSTLQQRGYVARTPRSRRFYPTARLLTLASTICANDPLSAASNEAVEFLSEETGETAIGGIIAEHHVEVIAVKEGRHELRYMVPLGKRMALHVSALGKALLSALEPAEARRLVGEKPLRPITPYSLTDPGKLLEQIATIRAAGVAEVVDEGSEGVGAMAVAGRIGDSPLALCIFGPKDRVSRNRDAYARALFKAREKVFGAEGREDESAA